MSHQKPIDERAGHHALPAVLDADALPALPVPDPPAGLPGDLRERWEGLWGSPVAAVLDRVSDLEPMARLFELYALDRRMRAAVKRHLDWLSSDDFTALDEAPPFDPQYARVSLAMSAEIRQLEQTLGITPRGRLTIGAAVAAVSKGAPEREEHDDADD